MGIGRKILYIIILLIIVIATAHFSLFNNKDITTQEIAKNNIPQNSTSSINTTAQPATSTEKIADISAVATTSTTTISTSTTNKTMPAKKLTATTKATTTTKKPVVTPVAEKEKISEPTTQPLTVNKTESPTLIPQKNTAPLSWGIYPGPTAESVLDFEKKISRNPNYIAHFVHWGNGKGELPSWLKDHTYYKNRTLVVFWEASDYKIGGSVQPDFSFRTILDGNHDDYLADFAEQIKSYEGPVILIPFSELNGNWNPWSGTTNSNTPEEAVQAFRYVHGFFDDVPNVKFGLAVNAASVPNTYENRIEAYYPGDAYVDYIGVDGFNMGNPWDSFSQIFDSPLKILSQYNKPLFIFSFASAEGAGKAEWLDDALNVQMPKYPLLKGFVYFNQNKERNWLLWSDQDTLSVFTEYISK